MLFEYVISNNKEVLTYYKKFTQNISKTAITSGFKIAKNVFTKFRTKLGFGE